MLIKNYKIKLEETVNVLIYPSGLYYFDDSEKPLNYSDGNLINIGNNFYNINELKKIITECEKQADDILKKYKMI